MATAELDTARKAISALLGGYLNIKTDNPAAIAAGYVAHLKDYPIFAIVAACDDFKNHRVVDHYDANGKEVLFTMDYPPSAFRLLDQVKKCCERENLEQYRITRVLAITKTTDAPALAPEVQQRVGAQLRELAESMRGKVNQQRAADAVENREKAQQARDRAKRIVEDARRKNREADLASQDRQARG